MDRFFVTSRGIRVEILAIQTLMEKFEASQRLPTVPDELRGIIGDAMPKPDAPTYDTKPITGLVEKHFHDANTVKTPEEIAAWEKYQSDLTKFNQDHAEKQARLICLYGIKFDMPKDDTWAQAQKEILGIDVPVDSLERKLHYINTEVIGGVGDVLEITKRCMLATLPEEKLREAEELFQRSMAGYYETAGLAGTAGQVDGELPIRASGGGATSTPIAAEPVRRTPRKR
jgi:hypothetical protein